MPGNSIRQKLAGGNAPALTRVTRSRRLRLADADGRNPYSFWLNPEQFSQSEGALVSILHTADGGVVTHWGRDFPHISLLGTTGVGRLAQLKALKAKVYDNFDSPLDGTPPWLRFYNFLNLEAWYVTVQRFDVKQSVQKPTLYGYAIEMTCVGGLDSSDQEFPSELLTGTGDVDAAEAGIGSALG